MAARPEPAVRWRRLAAANLDAAASFDAAASLDATF
jgi:hypothetical protein